MSDDVGEAIERARTHFRNATREGLEAVRALLEATQRALDLIETAAVLEPRRLRDGAGNRIEQASPVQGAPEV